MAVFRMLSRKDLLYVLALLLFSLLVTQIKLSQPSLHSAAFLFSDESHNFLVADALLKGAVLYKDVFYQYGYIPAYLYAGIAWLFGNSISTYLHLIQLLSAISIVAIYFLLRSVTSSANAFLITLLAILPQAIAPGAIAAGFTNSPYRTLEIILIAVCSLLWSSHYKQNLRWALLLGVCLGLWQGVKFGGAFVCGAAILLVDIYCLWGKSFARQTMKEWLMNRMVTLLGFLLIQLLWILISYSLLPKEIAKDVLLPLYMVDNYAGAVSSGDRYPSYISLRYFFSVQFVPLIGALGAIIFMVGNLGGLGRRESNPSESRAEYSRLLVPAMFFVLGSFIYFKQVWLYYAYAWTLTLGGFYLFNTQKRFLRSAVVVVWLLAFAAFCKNSLFISADPSLVELELPNKEKLWVTPTTQRRITALNQIISNRTSSSSIGRTTDAPPVVVFYSLGAGMHSFFNVPYKGRHYWFMPGFVRPYDEESMVKNLDATDYWVVLNDSDNVSADIDTWDGFIISPLNPILREQISRRLREPIRVDPHCVVFPIKDKSEADRNDN